MMNSTGKYVVIVFITISFVLGTSTGTLAVKMTHLLLYGHSVYALGSAVLINANVGGLRSDDPNKYAGLAGIVVGAFTATGGIALMASDIDELKPYGAVFTAIGLTSAYFGVKSVARVRAKCLERKKLALSVAPIFIGSDRCGVDIVFQCSVSF
jgi:hypothetical protein